MSRATPEDSSQLRNNRRGEPPMDDEEVEPDDEGTNNDSLTLYINILIDRCL